MKPIHKIYLLAAGLAILQTTGCASIVSGQNQPLSVITPGCDGAACELQNDKGKWFVPITPGTVSVSRSYSDLAVRCNKDGQAASTTGVRSSTKAMAFGNIIFGGVIGAGIDMGTGAAYDYPNEIVLPMECKGTIARAVPSAPAAIPGNDAKAKLGCVVKSLTNELALASGLPQSSGLMIMSVSPDGAAARAGLRPGDVMTEVNQNSIADAAAFRDMLAVMPPSSKLRLKVFRERQFIDIALQIDPEGEI